MKEIRYASKVDTWLLLVLLFAAGGALLAVAMSASASGIFIGLSAVALGVGLPLWTLASTHYAIGEERLRIQSGPFKWRIPLAEITSVEASRNPLASPALSLDRLHIRYGQGRSILISPKDRERFLNDLEQARQRIP